MDDLDPAILKALTHAVTRIDALVTRCEAVTAANPRPGSRASIDQAISHPGPKTPEIPHGRFPLMLATTAVGVAADHLRTFAGVLRAGSLPMYASLTLLRTALETAAFCRWLVDPALSPEERVARGIAAQLDDYDERGKFEDAFAPKEPRSGGLPAIVAREWRSGAERLAELAADLESPKAVAKLFDGPTAMVRDYGPPDDRRDPSWSYRLASAFSHGKTWALLAMTLGKSTQIAPGVRRGPVSANEGVVLVIAGRAIAGVDLALTDLERYITEKQGHPKSSTARRRIGRS